MEAPEEPTTLSIFTCFLRLALEIRRICTCKKPYRFQVVPYVIIHRVVRVCIAEQVFLQSNGDALNNTKQILLNCMGLGLLEFETVGMALDPLASLINHSWTPMPSACLRARRYVSRSLKPIFPCLESFKCPPRYQVNPTILFLTQ